MSRTPSFCWHCGGKLRNPRGPVPGVEVTDPLGNAHRVHKCCKADAERELRKITAKPPTQDELLVSGTYVWVAGGNRA